jgi:DNA-binding IclR family transcriptional regulator
MYNAPVLKKGIGILRLITGTNELLGVSEISRRLSIVKSTTLGILKALEEEGLVVQDPLTKKYVPGASLFDFSRRVLRTMELPFAAKPFLDRLVELVDETAILAVQEGDKTFRVLEVSEPKKELKITVPVGTRFPQYTGALTKVFLSRITNDEITRLVKENPLPRYTDHSLTRIEDLLKEVEQARQNGYAADLEEYRKGVRALAVLVFRGDQARMAISIFGLAGSMDDERLPDMVSEMKKTAASISRKMFLMTEGLDKAGSGLAGLGGSGQATDRADGTASRDEARSTDALKRIS